MPRPKQNKPKDSGRKARVRITGPAYRPLTNGELLALDRAPRQQWEGDARDASGSVPCGTCGGTVPVAEMRYSAPWGFHRGCYSLSSPASRLRAAALALFGADVTPEDSHVIASAMTALSYRSTPGAQPVHAAGAVPKAWAHVNRRTLRRVLQNLPDLRRQVGLDPTTCASGPCAWCGVRQATGWKDFGHRWVGGGKAPLCGTCSGKFVSHGGLSGRLSVTYYDEQRRAGYGVLIGRDLTMGYSQPPGFRLYAEVRETGHPGFDVPFGFIPAQHRPGTTEYAVRAARERAEAAQTRAAMSAATAEAERAERARWGHPEGTG